MKKTLFETLSRSPDETLEAGKRLGEYIRDSFEGLCSHGNVFVALYGDVGVGKTVFVTGLAKILSPGECVSSPTYAIVNEYRGKFRIVHYDMYRITSEDDLESTGFYDYKNCVIAAEWCENIPYALPEKRIDVVLGRTENENERSVGVYIADTSDR